MRRDTIVFMTDQLAEYLNALEREDRYRVDAVLKESPHEITQRVFLVGVDGLEQGPFIRKFIKRDAQMGGAYELVFNAQRKGVNPRHIPRVVDCYATDSDIVAVMEFVQGETLQDAMRRYGPSLSFAAAVFPAVCEAVSELHESFGTPIIHRDVKPTNIMLSQGDVKLIDLGIARAYKEGAQEDTVRFGTKSYAPPEQFGFGQTSIRSDVYALGMLLAFCLMGEDPLPALREGGFCDARIPEEMRKVIARATSFDPADRYADVRALDKAFSKAVETCKGAEKPRFSLLFRLWNAVIVMAVLFLAAACAVATFDPNEADMSLPLWFRILEYQGAATTAFFAIAYALLDKRRLRRRFPVLQRFGSVRVLLAGVAFAAIVFLFLTIVVALNPGMME